ncbi:hypothetical protein LXL04_012064 [Taraxacum kok-saghyz]
MEDLKERLFPSKPTSNITPRDLSHKPSSNPYGRQPFQGVISAANISKKMKVKFSKAWMSFLRLPLSIDVYKEVLVTLHQAVIPYLSNPILLCDFLTKSYDIGGVISVMALSSLFILMTEHGLEYPNLYGKLYALLQPSIFIAKHRAKFFQSSMSSKSIECQGGISQLLLGVDRMLEHQHLCHITSTSSTTPNPKVGGVVNIITTPKEEKKKEEIREEKERTGVAARCEINARERQTKNAKHERGVPPPKTSLLKPPRPR